MPIVHAYLDGAVLRDPITGEILGWFATVPEAWASALAARDALNGVLGMVGG